MLKFSTSSHEVYSNGYTTKIHPRSKFTHVQNPPDKKLYFCYLFIYFRNFSSFFLFIFYLFFTITITPNPFPRLVSGSQI